MTEEKTKIERPQTISQIAWSAVGGLQLAALRYQPRPVRAEVVLAAVAALAVGADRGQARMRIAGRQ